MVSANTYTKTAIRLHWVIAALIVFMLAGGFLMEFLPDDNLALTVMVFNWHKTIGMLILLLSVLRLVWRLTHKPPALDASIKSWEALLSKAVHVLFYGFMIGMPLIGWAIISTSRFPSKLFNVVPLAKLPILRDYTGDARARINDLFEEIHEIFAFMAIALILLHIIAAIKHHRADGVFMARMMPSINKKKLD